jgi:hypothetical protein
MFQPGTAEQISIFHDFPLYHSIKTAVPPQELLQALPALRRAQLAQQLPPALGAPLSLAAANGAATRHRMVILTSCMEEPLGSWGGWTSYPTWVGLKMS